MPVASSVWYAIGWADWTSVVGLPLTLLGLGLAWKQAKAASDSAAAARRAVEYTERRLRANQLLVLIPQLRMISIELDVFIESDEAALAKRQLDQWRWHASNVHGLLSVENPAEDELLKLIQESLGLATSAAAHLLTASSVPVLKKCAKARASIGKVCDDLSLWVGKNIARTSNGDQAS